MSSALLQELEDLRMTLETPKKGANNVINKLRASLESPHSTESYKAYDSAIHSAEKSVDRLGRAIEAAEEEMEASLRKTTNVYKQQLAQKDVEVQELKRVIAAKEKSIDSLRETLSVTKRSYETRLVQLEASGANRDGEVRDLQHELEIARGELELMDTRMKNELTEWVQSDHDAKEREKTLRQMIREQEVQLSETEKSKKQHQQKQEQAQWKLERLQEELRECREELRLTRDKVATQEDLITAVRQQLEGEQTHRTAEKQQLDLELYELRKRLKAEKSLRKASEQWLKTELKTREEMEGLFRALKEVAAGRVPSQYEEVEGLISDMKKLSEPTLRHQTDFKAMKRLMEGDNQRLKEELQAARQMLKERLQAL